MVWWSGKRGLSSIMRSIMGMYDEKIQAENEGKGSDQVW